jgi:hypothetical protein
MPPALLHVRSERRLENPQKPAHTRHGVTSHVNVGPGVFLAFSGHRWSSFTRRWSRVQPDLELPSPSVASSAMDRRASPERRLRSHLLSDWKYAFRGKRRMSRRGIHEPDFVDLYEPPLLLVTLGILALSVLDAAFTLALIQAGVAVEANPILRWLIAYDVQLFVNLKLVITSAGIVFLVVLSSAPVLKRHRGRIALHALLVLYALVIGYELVLLRTFGVM